MMIKTDADMLDVTKSVTESAILVILIDTIVIFLWWLYG